MRNLRNKPIFIVSISTLLILSSLSANKSLFPSLSWISYDTKMNCIQFQNLRGSNRINEFQKIAFEIFSNKKNEDKQDNLNLTLNNIQKLLGKPDNVLPNGDWEYYLDYSQEGGKAILFQDKNAEHIAYRIVSKNK